MADLKVVDSIDVQTRNGPGQIQLAFGSVTKVSKDEEVDVLVISAFPNDYTPTKTSVIGALKRDLGLSVAALAKDKEQDLRSIGSCWWSKPLSGKLGFHRILCFEGGSKTLSRPPMVVTEVFTSLALLCNNIKEQEIKVMMPVIASGDQDYSEDMMLRLMVQSSFELMQHDIPLKMIKIVIYSNTLYRINQHPLLQYFKKLKKEVIPKMTTNLKRLLALQVNYDVYLSYSKHNEHLANKVRRVLSKKFDKIRIYSAKSDLSIGKSCQEDLRTVMGACGRFLAILSPEYLADEVCMEQYSTALSYTSNLRPNFGSMKKLSVHMTLNPPDRLSLDELKIDQACSEAVDLIELHLGNMDYVEELAIEEELATEEELGNINGEIEPADYDRACENDDVVEVRHTQGGGKVPKVAIEHLDLAIQSPDSCQEQPSFDETAIQSSEKKI